MEYKEYRYVDRSNWLPGEWDNEPDKIQFIDEATGLPCLIVRQPNSGHLCGYVGVSKSHPFYGKDYSDDVNCENRNEIKIGKQSLISIFCEAIKDDDGKVRLDTLLDVHGGITFADKCHESPDGHGICHLVEPGEDDDIWWFGFDCAHAWDSAPKKKVDPYAFDFGDSQYRNLTYVKAEIASLAKQLKEI